MNEQPYYLSIAHLNARLRAMEISPVVIVQACLARIDVLNPRLNAFITVLSDQAREGARQADDEIRAGRWRGPLHGVPVGIKDFYDTANIRTTAGFEKFKDRVPEHDAAVVRTLKDAGAVVVGKMNMDRLGMAATGIESDFGPVHNPWSDRHIPGGSSSGSAAAVAAGLCCATLDTDAIGSCRLPAACCGVVGFKGTFGAISPEGILQGEKTDETILKLSHPGITTRSAEDTAIVFTVLAEPNRQPPIENRLRVGVANNFTADREVTLAFRKAVDAMRVLGHETVPTRAPLDIPPFGDLHSIDADRRTISDRAFKDIDVLLLPTTVRTVPTIEDARTNPPAVSAANTMFANYFGLPAVSAPCGFDERGLPIGLQIVGKPSHDATVLRLAHEYEATVQSRRKRPIP